MKLVRVTQWVRTGEVQIPPDPSLDVHFISSSPVEPQSVYRVEGDKKHVQTDGAGGSTMPVPAVVGAAVDSRAWRGPRVAPGLGPTRRMSVMGVVDVQSVHHTRGQVIRGTAVPTFQQPPRQDAQPPCPLGEP
jgi:hypothetical protein